MFLDVLNWMLAHVPGFMRPGVSWLLSGLRSITGYVSARWNALGRAAGSVYGAVAALRVHLSQFAITVYAMGLWLRDVWIPRQIQVTAGSITRWAATLLTLARNEVLGWVAQLDRLISYAVTWAGQRIDALQGYVNAWLSDLSDWAHKLTGALLHVLSGPDVLAEWVFAALWRTAMRWLLGNRDRLMDWLLRGSIGFAARLAEILEDMIVRRL